MSDFSSPALPAAPLRKDRRLAIAGTWVGLAVACAFGSLADAAVRAPAGLALTLGTWLAAAAVIVLGRPRRVALPYLAASAILGVFFVLRTSVVLTGLTLLGAGSLLCIGASFTLLGTPASTSLRSYLSRVLWAPAEALPDGAAGLAGPPVRAAGASGRSIRSVVRTLLVVVPVTLILLVVLAGADPVFARYVRAPLALSLSSAPTHLLLVAVGALALATLIAMATRGSCRIEQVAQRPVRATWARPAEWITLLAVTDAIFAAFVAMQFAVFFGGRTRVVTERGLTYAQYARSGFWQLLVATGIAGGIVAFAWAALPRPTPGRVRVAFLVLSLLLIGLVLVVLDSAFGRLALYENAYGFTWLRVLVHATMLAIGVALLCTVVALVVGRASWLPTAAVVIATATVFGLNAMNLDAFIAERNIARSMHGAALDVQDLSLLSLDAVPAMLAALPAVSPRSRRSLEGVLACARDAARHDVGWAGINRARDQAIAALGDQPLTSPCWG